MKFGEEKLNTFTYLLESKYILIRYGLKSKLYGMAKLIKSPVQPRIPVTLVLEVE